jgi:hypothetical protein
MIEILDNAIQIIVVAAGAAAAGIFYARRHSEAMLILALFYLTFFSGLLYWLLFLVLKTYTPRVFYVSDISWLGGFLFLLTLEQYLQTPEEKAFRHPAMLLAPALGIPLTVFYMVRGGGDYLYNALCGGLTIAAGVLAIRGLLFARRQKGAQREYWWFHAAVLAELILEYCLWTASCFWSGGSLANPYFWFDFALTVSLALLYPALKKAVQP